MFWTDRDIIVPYLGLDFTLRAETKDRAPSIAFEHGTKGMSQTEAITAARRFMSALSWVERRGVRDAFWTGGGFPVGIGKQPGRSWSKCMGYIVWWLPIPTNDKQRLALALYREALATNTEPYKFLAFSRLINMIANKGPAQKDWINANLAHVVGEDAKTLIGQLQSAYGDVGKHLYESGRCAVAHAFEEPIIDPDVWEHVRRMKDEMPLIRALAEVVVEKELGVMTRDAVHKTLSGNPRAQIAGVMSREVLDRQRAVPSPPWTAPD
jgi:hypothetical protein